MTDSPVILRSSTSADFLATLPTLMGHAVHESIVIVPFWDRRTRGMMRLDLPSPDAPEEHARICSLALGALSRLEGCDGVTFVVYTDDTFPVAFASWDAMVRRLDDGFAAAGFQVKEALCVAADGHASWYEDDPPFDGHPLSEIEDSPLVAQAAAVREGKEPPAPAGDLDLPPADPAIAQLLPDAVLDLLLEGEERDAFGRFVRAELPDALDLVEQLLASEPDEVAFPAMARFAALALLPARRDEMTLQIAFGRDIGERARADSDRWHARQRETGLSMDEAVAAEGTTGELSPHDPGALFLGESDRLPEVARVRRAIGLLRRVLAHLPGHLRPDLLCMLAWLHWALGAGTAAGHHLDSALRLDPDHGMAGILFSVVGSGKIPEWVFGLHNAAAPPPSSGNRARAARP